jgi:vitamin B12 transporter
MSLADRVQFRFLLVAFCIVVLFATLVHADSLTGTVLDPDGKAVPNARVRLFNRYSGEMRSTTASASGAYSFPGIPSGVYLLEGTDSRASLNGSSQISVDGDPHHDLKLSVSGTSTSVLVTASTSPLSIRDVGKAIDVISAEDLSLRDEFSLAEAVRTLPGVRVQTLEGPGSFTTILTRGLRPQDTAVLIDGMRFHDAGSPQNDATAFLEDMLTTDTDRIEFLRGSGSSLYGSNALGGVINVTSHPGGGPRHEDLRVEGGGLGIIRGVAGVSGGLLTDKLTYSGKGSHFYMTRGVREKLPYRNNSAQGTLKYSFKPRLSLTGRAWYSNGYVTSTESPFVNGATLANSSGAQEVEAIPLPLDQLERFEKGQPYNAGNATYIPNTIDPDGRRRGSYLSSMLTFQHDITPGLAYRVAWQSVDTRRALLDGPQGVGPFEAFATPRSNFDGFVDTLQGKLDLSLGAHNFLTFGYEYDRERYFSYDGDDSSAASADRINLSQRSNAVYVQDQIRLLDGRLQMTAAGRAQSFDLIEPEFQGLNNPYSASLSSIDVPTAYTGDGSIAYFINGSQTKLRSHVGNSFRAPSGYERFGGGFGSYYGDPRLAPERSIALDAGVDQWLFGSKAQLSATWFYTNLQQTIRFVNSFAPGADPFGRVFGGYANGGGGIARGFEFGGNFSPRTGTQIQGSYTYVNSDSRIPTVAPDYYSILDVSPHVFTVAATQWISRQTRVTFDLAAHSDYVLTLQGGGTRRFRFNGPIKPDVVVSHRLPLGEDHNVEVYGKLENMFGRRLHEDGYIGPAAWFLAGFRINY